MYFPPVPTFLAGLLLASAALPAAPAPLPAAAQTELALLRSLPPDLVVRTMRGAKPDARGFVGHQQKQELFEPSLQRGGAYTLAAGVALRRPEWIDEGWQVLDVTFGRQNSDGSLGEAVKPADRATTDAFFLCWAARALLLLQSDEPFSKQYAEKIAATLPKLRISMDWLATQIEPLDVGNTHAPNRCFIIATAFAFGAELLGHDPKLAALGRRYIDLGLKSFQPDSGVFAEPSRGVESGPDQGDSSYEAVSILVLNFYRLHVADERLDEPLRKATAWELTRINTEGQVSAAGNTRTGEGQEVSDGQPKGINYPEVVQALAYQAVRAQDGAAWEAAGRVLERNVKPMRK